MIEITKYSLLVIYCLIGEYSFNSIMGQRLKFISLALSISCLTLISNGGYTTAWIMDGKTKHDLTIQQLYLVQQY